MRPRLEAAGWAVVLFGAGFGAITVGRAMAPAYTGDPADSNLYWLLTLVVAALAFVAGYRTNPRMACMLGLVAALPNFALALGIGYPMTAEERAFMWMSFVWMLPIAVLFVLAALIGSAVRSSRERRVSSPSV